VEVHFMWKYRKLR